MWRGFLLGVLCACGRLNFDGRSDAAELGDGLPFEGVIGHDEDGDGVPDTTDRCPHIADPTQPDGDNDGVGDDCDTAPGIASQWVLFAPLTGGDPVQPSGTNWTVEFDRWRYVDDANPAQLIIANPPTEVDIYVGVDVDTIGTGGVQAAIILRNGGASTPYYYGELFDNGSSATANISYYTGTSYIALATTPVGPAFPVGPMVFYLSARSGTPNLTFVALVGSTPYAANVTMSGGAVSTLIVGFGNHSGSVRYLAIVGH